jgi:hypothetical protein
MMFLSGMCAGSIGYLAANPLFLVKTQIQAEAGRVVDGVYTTGLRVGHPPTYRNGWHALRTLAMQDGLSAWWRGCGLLVARGGVMSASQTATYDGVKTSLLQLGAMSDGPTL